MICAGERKNVLKKTNGTGYIIAIKVTLFCGTRLKTEHFIG